MRAIALGAACNNACVFCAQGELRAQPDRARIEGVERRIEAIEPGEAVAFQGGEPTIFEDLCAWIRAADARGPSRIVLQTNARRLAYREYARALREASPRLSLDASLHGSTAPMHDYHTGVPKSFAQTALGLRHARAEGIPFGITTVVTRSNFRHLGEIVQLARALGAAAVHFAFAEPVGRALASRDRVVPAPELVRPHLAHALAEAKRAGLGVVAGDRASSPAVAALFAGTGEVEGAPAKPAEAGTKRVSLAVLGRPAPGRSEARGSQKRSGADLAEILPALFDGSEIPGGGIG